jgi:L-cysteate sulfo-lyase
VINATVQPVRLGTSPTPLEAGPRLAEALGLDRGDLWFKREDLCGLGGGGNKVRKLEWTCAAALAAVPARSLPAVQRKAIMRG